MPPEFFPNSPAGGSRPGVLCKGITSQARFGKGDILPVIFPPAFSWRSLIDSDGKAFVSRLRLVSRLPLPVPDAHPRGFGGPDDKQ